MERLHHGTKVLLAYFHYSNKGSYPFTMDWSVPSQVACMNLDQEQVTFMSQTVEAIEGKCESMFRFTLWRAMCRADLAMSQARCFSKSGAIVNSSTTITSFRSCTMPTGSQFIQYRENAWWHMFALYQI